jgi:predicted phosphodiesterase
VKPALTTALLVFFCCSPAERDSVPLRVAVLGDRTGGHTPGVFPAIIDEVNSRDPDVVLAVGDLIEGYNKDIETIRDQWQEVLPMLQRIRAPLLVCPGNHDVFSAASEDLYKELIGPLYHTREVAGVRFYMLDVSRAVLPEQIGAGQWEWLRTELGSAPSSAGKVVVMHRPLWLHTLAAGLPDSLHDLFVQEGVDLAVAGHEHKYFYAEYDGVRYVSVGPSGGSFFFWGPGDVQFHQYLWVTIQDGAFDIGVVKSGEVLPADITTLREAKLGHAAHARGLVLSEVRFGPGGADDTIVAEVRSLGGSTPEGTLIWDVPSGWSVSPCSLRFAVARRETARCTFTLVGRRPWPAPVIRTSYPYGRHHVAALELPAPIVRELPCIELSDDIVVDGKLDPAWRQVASEDLLYVSEGKEGPAGVASFRVGRRAGEILVWASCGPWEGEPPVESRGGRLKHDDALFVALQPGGRGPVYTILINGAGEIAVSPGAGSQWRDGLTSAVTRGISGWDAELAVPLTCMPGAEARGSWGLNFGRRHPVQEGRDIWVTTAQWMPVSAADTTGLGRLVLE